MNNYKKAILNNETDDFLLGKNKYFIHDRDYAGHDITATYSDLLNYGNEEGEQVLFIQMEIDIIRLLKNKDLTLDDFTNLLGFIWFYFKYKFDYKKIMSNWDISEKLIKSFIYKYQELKKTNDTSDVLRINNILKHNYGFNLLEI